MTYQALLEQTKGQSLPVTGINDRGEFVIIDHGTGEAGNFFKVTACQENNWVRVSSYYEDGMYEESYQL